MNQRYKGLTLAVVGACFWGASGTMIQFLAPVFIIIYSSLRSKMWLRRIDAISIVVAVVGTFILATVADSINLLYHRLLVSGA